MSSKPAGPDVRQLREQKLPGGEFPGGRNQEFRVGFDQGVHAEIWHHAGQDTSVEICGVLVGSLSCDAQGPFVHVSASIRGEAASNKFAEVTFTHETWNRINKEMDTKFTDRAIVGWYHTHPNFGIFLSERDQFICQNFFSGPGQIAHVVDPIRKLEGVFVWKEGKAQPTPFYWVSDRLLTHPREEQPTAPVGGIPAGASGGGDVLAAEAMPSTYTPLWMNILLVVSVFVLGYLLHGSIDAAVVERHVQEAKAHNIVQLGMRYGLNAQLDEVSERLQSLGHRSIQLANNHTKLVDASKDLDDKSKAEVKVAWQNVLGETSSLLGKLQETKEQYCLSREESNLVDAILKKQFDADKRRAAKDAEDHAKEEKSTGEKTPDKAGEKTSNGKEGKPSEKRAPDKSEAKKPEAASAEPKPKAEPSKSDTAKPQPPKSESPKTEPAKTKPSEPAADTPKPPASD